MEAKKKKKKQEREKVYEMIERNDTFNFQFFFLNNF